MNINNIWAEQEIDELFSSGLLLRRVDISCLPDVSIGLISENKSRCLCLSISRGITIDLSLYNKLQDVSFRCLPDSSDKTKQLMAIILENPLHNEVFAVLCQDLISSVSYLQSEDSILKVLFARFSNWNTLFSKNNGERLSQEQQRGLYGELVLLKTLLNDSIDYLSCISSWTGPEAGVRDFQQHGWAIEVKTSKGNRHQKIHINGDRQLDDRLLENLFLYHISLEVLRLHGETLNEIVSKIDQILSSNALALNRFHLSLLLAGYRNEDVEYYETAGYLIRESNFYKVEADFPRIREGDLPPTIGDIEYSIMLSDCERFIKKYEEVQITINNL